MTPPPNFSRLLLVGIGLAALALLLLPFLFVAVALFLFGLLLAGGGHICVLFISLCLSKRRERKNYGKTTVPPRDGPHPVETCPCPLCEQRRQDLSWPSPA